MLPIARIQLLRAQSAGPPLLAPLRVFVVGMLVRRPLQTFLISLYFVLTTFCCTLLQL